MGPQGPIGLTGAVGPQGDSGVTGQFAVSRLGTAQLNLVVLSGNYIAVPGLSQTIINSGDDDQLVFIATSGSFDAAILVGFDIAIFIDGVRVNGGTRHCTLAGLTLDLVGGWGHSIVTSLAPGTHTIDVRAKLTLGLNVSVGLLGDSQESTLTILGINQ
jgi:hypothetical protein